MCVGLQVEAAFWGVGKANEERGKVKLFFSDEKEEIGSVSFRSNNLKLPDEKYLWVIWWERVFGATLMVKKVKKTKENESFR